ncbi:MAG: ethanolamine ammonia-lyase subunit EutC [Clostridia bacterium]|nr:ethanolamine ammonia-lyase subunit EutC [Clostridia bacterium]
MNNEQVESIVKAVMAQLAASGDLPATAQESTVRQAVQTTVAASPAADIEDIADPEVKHRPLLDNPADADGLQRMLSKTPARIGVGKAGARLKTKTQLALRADHAAARDSVFADVDENLIQEMNLLSVQTCCHDRNEHLTRPDLGRKFDEKTAAELKAHCTANPDVQFIVSDGLSSKAIEANIKNVLPAVMDGVKALGYSVGTPFFVKFGRVGCMDHAGELLGSKVTCILIGERPGLGTAESMSAYITYGSKVGMSESLRTVVSNIHSGGITPVEAGAYLAEVIDLIMKNKASGVNLRK